ncbi:MAG: diaminopimelate epimerase, partial [Xanthobacteraceae bacterium]
MGALANKDFIKMNGLGNEIVIVDLRAAPSAASSQVAA